MADVKPLSDEISGSMEKLHRAGLLALSSIVAGALLLLSAATIPMWEPARFILSVVGTGSLGFAGVFFWRYHVRPIQRARERIERDAELIDTVQKTALELVVTARAFQGLAFSHADRVASLVHGVGPQVRAIPYLGRSLGEAIERSETLAADIARVSGRARGVTDDIERALRESDIEAMRSYLERLRGVRREVSHMAPDRAAPGPDRPAEPG